MNEVNKVLGWMKTNIVTIGSAAAGLIIGGFVGLGWGFAIAAVLVGLEAWAWFTK